MSQPKSISLHKAPIYLLLVLFMVTSCSIRQKSSIPQQSYPNKQVTDIGKQQQSPPIRWSNTRPLDTIPVGAIPTEPPQQSTPNKQVQELEKVLGIAIEENDPDMPLYTEAAKWIGTRYKYRGMAESGVDCSGLTSLLYKAVYKKTLQRSSADMARHNVVAIDKSLLKAGDLIFFATSGNARAITHVGVYLKDNRFIHASSRAGVVVNNLNEDYYRKTFVKCGRVE